jgi:hypothetical protein
VQRQPERVFNNTHLIIKQNQAVSAAFLDYLYAALVPIFLIHHRHSFINYPHFPTEVALILRDD